MRLASLDGELFVKNCFYKFRIIFSSIDPRRMKMPPFDASRHGDSDDMCFKFIRSLDGEILQFKSQFLELSGYFWQVSVLLYNQQIARLSQICQDQFPSLGVMRRGNTLLKYFVSVLILFVYFRGCY